MGFFSWIAQDSNKSIWNIHSGRKVKTVWMLDDKGNVWSESEYDGYGVFGGKDYYELLAEMNGFEPDREIGIRLENGIRGIINQNNDIYLSQGINFFNWQEDEVYNGFSANKLVEMAGFSKIMVHYSGLKYPNLVHKLRSWKNEKPESCPNQGYFDFD